jgi:superfamily II DNA or RNA helicase
MDDLHSKPRKKIRQALMSQIITIAANATTAKVQTPSREALLEIQRALSYRVAGSEHSAAFKSGSWDGRSTFLNFKTGTFPAGFLHFVSANLRRAGYVVRHARKPLPPPLGPQKPKVDAFPEDPRYDYQNEVVERLLKFGQIIAQVATGGGKSRIARLAYARIGRPTLFLTTRGILMYQMKDAFEKDMGVSCSVLGDGQFGHLNSDGRQSVKKMCVGMVQTLVSRLQEKTVEAEFLAIATAFKTKQNARYAAAEKALMTKRLDAKEISARLKKLHEADMVELKANKRQMMQDAEKRVAEQTLIRQQTINLLSMFELVILEEAHEASGNGYFEIMRHCKNAHYRLALTATPFMKDDEEANMRLMASSGPIAIKITEKLLIDRGILAKPYFKYVQLKERPNKLMRGTGWQAAYRLGIVDNEERNGVVVKEVKRASTFGLSSMVLAQHKKHGEVLVGMMTAAGLRTEFIQGENDQAERKAALKKLANGELDALIGTTILDVGVDVPAVGLIVLAGGGKAEVALRQRIGRGLRAKKRGPNVAFVVDFDDTWNMHTKGHAAQRRSIVSDTEGFGENIVSGDFDYKSLGFVRA